MANKFPGRGNFDIPSALLDEHEWMVDELIDGATGHNCKLVYPPKQTECPNCIIDPDIGRSAGIYKDGGPFPFTNHTRCPYCNGVGRSEERVEETIRLRVYWDQSSWITKYPFENPDGVGMIIGYMTDIHKIKRAIEFIVESDFRDYKEWKCVLENEPQPWGFQRRYFVAYIRRAG